MTSFESATPLACLAAGDVAGARAAAQQASAPAGDHELVVERDGRAYTLAGRTVSLQRRGNLRRIVLALVEKRLAGHCAHARRGARGGAAGRTHALESGALRVYTAVRRLRQGGLGVALVTTDDGYLIDPRVTARLSGR